MCSFCGWMGKNYVRYSSLRWFTRCAAGYHGRGATPSKWSAVLRMPSKTCTISRLALIFIRKRFSKGKMTINIEFRGYESSFAGIVNRCRRTFPHLHGNFNFRETILETVRKSLHLHRLVPSGIHFKTRQMQVAEAKHALFASGASYSAFRP